MFLNNFNFEKLISPVSKSDFYENHFGKKQLLIKRNDTNYYQDLLTADMLDELLFHWPNLATVVKADRHEGRRQDMHGSVTQFNTSTIFNELDQGHTLIMDKLDNRIPSLSKMHAKLEQETHYNYQSNIYITPPATQGFRAHFDDHHVFILQTHGKKQWRVNDYAEPLDTPADKAMKLTIHKEKHQSFLLEEGDILYIPPYTVHEAEGQTEYSVHITLSPYPPSYRNLLNHYLKSLDANHPLNQALPMGYFDTNEDDLKTGIKEGLSRVSNEIDNFSFERFIESQFNSLRGLYNGALSQRISPLANIAEYSYRANKSVSRKINRNSDVITVKMPNKEAQFPALFEASLLFCLESDEFTVNEIPEMSPEEAEVLISRLLGEGLIQKV